jgi:hypothetical protein
VEREEVELVFRVDTAVDALEELRLKMDRLKSETQNLDRALEQGYISIDQHGKEHARLGKELRSTEKEFRTVGIRAERTAEAVKKSADKGAKATGNWTNQVSMVGHALDDLQYIGTMGIQPVLNNVMMMSPALGIAALGAYQLYTHWDKLGRAFTQTDVRTQAEQMEELAKATNRTAEQTAKLEQYQRRQANVQNQANLRPSSESARESAMGRVLAESGGTDRLRSLLLQGLGTGRDGLDPLSAGYQEFQDAQGEIDSRVARHGDNAQIDRTLTEAVKAAREKNKAAMNDRANSMLERAQFGDDADMRALIGRLRAQGAQGNDGAARMAEQMEQELWLAQGGQDSLDDNEAENARRTAETKRKREQEAASAVERRYAQMTAGAGGDFSDLGPDVGKRAAKLFRERFDRDVKDLAENLGVALEEAERIFTDRAKDEARRRSKALADEEQMRATGRTVEQEREHYRQRAVARAERLAGVGYDAAQGQGVDPVAQATRMLMTLRTTRQFGGAGMEQGQALDHTRNAAMSYAMRSRFAGGLGMNREAAAEFAQSVLMQAAPQAQKNLEEQFAGVVTSSRDLKEAVMANVRVTQEALRTGVGIWLK